MKTTQKLLFAIILATGFGQLQANNIAWHLYEQLTGQVRSIANTIDAQHQSLVGKYQTHINSWKPSNCAVDNKTGKQMIQAIAYDAAQLPLSWPKMTACVFTVAATYIARRLFESSDKKKLKKLHNKLDNELDKLDNKLDKLDSKLDRLPVRNS